MKKRSPEMPKRPTLATVLVVDVRWPLNADNVKRARLSAECDRGVDVLTTALSKSLPGVLLIENVIIVAQKQLLRSCWTCMTRHWLTSVLTLLGHHCSWLWSIVSPVSALLSKVLHWWPSYKEFYWQSEVWSMLWGREHKVIDCSWST